MVSTSRTGLQDRHTLLVILFLAPSVLIFLLYRIIPIGWNLVLSFQHWKLFGPKPFVGLKHYGQMLTDHVFWHSFGNTMFYFLGGSVIPIFLALGLALLVNKPLKGRNVYRAMIFLPYPITPVAIAIIWKWLYDDKVGLINFILRSLGLIKQGIPFLSSFSLALPSLIFTTIWQVLGYFVIIILAGLQTIPTELYESAELDGATGSKKTRYVTIPLIRPTLFLCFIVGIINSFTTFDMVYVMTDGGPGHATEILITYIYKSAFTYNQLGYGAALTVAMFLFLLLISIISNRISGGEAGGVHFYD